MLICMDCRHEIVRVGSVEFEGRSHGLCVDCYARRIGDIGEEDTAHLAAAALDLLPGGAILLDRDLRVVAYNSAESTLTGLSPERVIGRVFFTEIAPCMAGAEVGDWCAQHVGVPALVDLQIEWLLRLRDGDRVARLDIQAGLGRVTLRVNLMPTELRPSRVA